MLTRWKTLPVVLILLENLIGWSQTSSACTLRLHRKSYIYVFILLILYVSSIFNKKGKSPWMVVAMVSCGSLGRAALSINWWVSGIIPAVQEWHMDHPWICEYVCEWIKWFKCGINANQFLYPSFPRFSRGHKVPESAKPAFQLANIFMQLSLYFAHA